MLALPGSKARLCTGLTRREWLRVGALPAAGLTLPTLLRDRALAERIAPAKRAGGRARSCIILFLFGGPAHQDIWDLKPDAKSDYRGEFSPIATPVVGITVGEHIPRTAAQANRLALVRSVSHPDNTHTVAMHYMLTGVRHAQPQTNPQNQPTDFPTFGAVVQHLRPGKSSLPNAVSLNAPANQVSANNHIFPGFFAGFLGGACNPMFVADDPSAAGFRPFPAAEGAAARQLDDRRSLLAAIEEQYRRIEAVGAVRAFDVFHEKAFGLVSSAKAREAFDLSRESDRVRDRYGRSAFGQGCLLARRLVEAGVGLVTVNWARNDAFWDTHADNFKKLKTELLPPFDLGFAALIDDLAQRGLLDETLVVCLGEFGRTPKISANAGREHWAACQTVVFAGGGVRGGQVIGSSDRIAAYPATRPVSPSDLAATLYQALGIPLDAELRDALGRPFALCSGQPIQELFV
jgi:hypothetical protein